MDSENFKYLKPGTIIRSTYKEFGWHFSSKEFIKGRMFALISENEILMLIEKNKYGNAGIFLHKTKLIWLYDYQIVRSFNEIKYD